MSDKTKTWLKAAGVRAVKTMSQTAAAVILVLATQTSIVEGYPSIIGLDWMVLLGATLFAGVFSLLTSLGGLPEIKVDDDSEKVGGTE